MQLQLEKSRRGFVTALGGGLAGLTVLEPLLRAGQVVGGGGPVGVRGPYSVSQSLVSGTGASASVVAHELVSRTLSATDLRRFSTTLGLLYANLDEVGATPRMEADMKAAGILDAPLSYGQLTSVRQQAAAAGINTSDAEFARAFLGVQAAWPVFQDLYTNGGLAAVQANVLTALNGLAAQVESQPVSSLGGGHLTRVNRPMWTNCDTLNAAAFYFDTWGYMLWIEAVSFGPVGPGVLLFAGIGLHAAQYFMGC